MLALSVVGFALAAVYALVGAPDVALVAVVVETMLTLVFLAALARLPRRASRTATATRRSASGTGVGTSSPARWRGLPCSPRCGASCPSPPASTVSSEHIRLTPAAHGGDVVTVIVADFRGLDTLVEITVLLAAVIGVVALLRRGRLW